MRRKVKDKKGKDITDRIVVKDQVAVFDPYNYHLWVGDEIIGRVVHGKPYFEEGITMEKPKKPKR